MKTIDKILKICGKNLGITVVLCAAIILFAIFSNGLIGGIITALSALIAYACVVLLYREFTKKPTPHKKKK